MNDICCGNGNCNGGPPSLCSTECTAVFRPFVADCSNALIVLGGTADLARMQGFLRICEQSNGCPMSFIEDTTSMQGICSASGFCSTDLALGDDLPWLQFVENAAVAEALSLATGGTGRFEDGLPHCVCDVGYGGDACETLYLPELDPCISEQLLVSGECDFEGTRMELPGSTNPEPGRFSHCRC